jgi:predicted PurR-regulated permease PerM
MVGAIVGASVAGVPGALVSVPLLGAGKAIYLEATGQARTKPRTASRSVIQRLQARFGHRKESPQGADDPPR